MGIPIESHGNFKKMYTIIRTKTAYIYVDIVGEKYTKVEFNNEKIELFSIATQEYDNIPFSNIVVSLSNITLFSSVRFLRSSIHKSILYDVLYYDFMKGESCPILQKLPNFKLCKLATYLCPDFGYNIPGGTILEFKTIKQTIAICLSEQVF